MKLAIALLLASRAAFGAIALDQKSSKINASSATTCVTPAITTTGGAGEIIVVALDIDATVASPTISDTASLAWTRLGLTSSSPGGSAVTNAIWYATTSGNLTSWTSTTGGTSHGYACAAWAFTGAGTPTNYTTSTTGSPSAEQMTIGAGTGSFLVGIGEDVTATANLTALANTTINQGSGVAANWYLSFYTTAAISGSTAFGSSTTGHSYSLSGCEVPAASGGGGATAPPTRTLLGVGT